MQLPFSLLVLISSFAISSARPAPHRSAPRDINISHKSLATGTTTTHSIDATLLPAELAAAIEGSDVNINLCVLFLLFHPAIVTDFCFLFSTTDREKRGINNSTINLTVRFFPPHFPSLPSQLITLPCRSSTRERSAPPPLPPLSTTTSTSMLQLPAPARLAASTTRRSTST
jgi:hypothetical protein